MRILVTGCAGFIGSHVSERLLNSGYEVYGIDNLNDYYDVNQKIKNLEILSTYENFIFKKEDIVNTNIINEVKPEKVCHLASMAGVRYSIDNPDIYVNVNIGGFTNLVEQAVKNNVSNFVYASSSSVYGLNKKVPFSEDDPIESCNSPYAASKRSMEIFANTYNQLYGLPLIGLRFFTVYGPEGRPDMAPMLFADSMLRGKPINVNNYGKMFRDFTYIDDIVGAIYKCCFKIPFPNSSFYNHDPEPSTSFAPHRIFNVGSNNPISLIDFIEKLEYALNVKAIKKMKEFPPGEVESTFADISKIQEWIDYSPNTSFENGISNFALWFKNYFESDYYARHNIS